MAFFGQFLGPYSRSNFAEIFTRDSNFAETNKFWIIFENFQFSRKWDTQSWLFWSSFNHPSNPCYPLMMIKIKESKKKIKAVTYPTMEPLIVVCWICKKFAPTTFKFCGHRSQRRFQKNFNVDFQVLLLFLVPRPFFFKKTKSHFIMQNLMLN